MTTEERADPEDPKWRNNPWYKVFLQRTDFAKVFAMDAIVLDAPCGVGWTSCRLAEVAKTVYAVDYSNGALQVARQKYDHAGVRYLQMNALNLGFADSSFDVAVSLEAMEHFDKCDGVKYLAELGRVLRRGGILVGSTPAAFSPAHAKEILRQHPNEFHKLIYTEGELRQALARFFSSVAIFFMKEGYFLFLGINHKGTPLYKRIAKRVLGNRVWKNLVVLRAACRRSLTSGTRTLSLLVDQVFMKKS